MHTQHERMYNSLVNLSHPPTSHRSNVRSVFLTATVFAVAQSLIFFLYAAGYVFGAYLVVEGRNSYDDIFR